MSEICAECGLPVKVCSGIVLACMAVAEMQGVPPSEGIGLYREAMEGAFRKIFVGSNKQGKKE